ncbi:MAG: deoxyguanosinetriphosphate triphosphohydrolase [Omnitrophica bacterium RBG_13_46_9]|nr:MAG: deoxyguanosinetriphosphate triphosphohydrolase [Omnitrophica bacterium RBG_13_46_9]
MLTRKEIEEQELLILAVYATKSRKTEGRLHAEKEHTYRSVYQRDRDRIIYSTAFRRLEYKTQVFVNHEGDHYRTRLTHTLEVTQIAKTIARALRLNSELVEAIALAHDLGHTPFGHSGEDALSELMSDHGGFDHNSQGLRVVDLLEDIYPDFPGLNLTHEVREGIIKHSTPFDKPRLYIPFESKGSPSLEIQVVDIADEIAYDNHDLDDGLTGGLLNEEGFEEIQLWKKMRHLVRQSYPNVPRKIERSQIVRNLINAQVTDLIKNTENKLRKFKIKSPRDVRDFPERIVTFSSEMGNLRRPLRDFLVKNLYHHYRVVRMSKKAYRFIKYLFDAYIENDEQLPSSQAARLRTEDKFRVVCDYIAGMTDRYALDEYKKFFNPYEKV